MVPLSYEVLESKTLERTYESSPKPEIELEKIINQIHVIDEQIAIEIKEYESEVVQ